MTNEFGFVLGNGKTRLAINPDDLKKRGTVYACNRAYQDFMPDYLISVDKNMAWEIQDLAINELCKHYTRINNIKSGSTSIPIGEYSGYSSGPVAASIAAHNSHPYIFLIGVDLKSTDGLINNLYAGTDFYRPSTDRVTPYDNWISQFTEIARAYPYLRFIHVNPLENFTPEQWLQQDNFSVMDVIQFRLMINN